MKKLSVLTLLLVVLNSLQLVAQNNSQDLVKYDKVSLGLGIGQMYGGIGANFLFYPQTNVGLFAGLGYAIVGPGYNAGVKIRFVSQKAERSIKPYVTAMYGYNTAVLVLDNTDLNKMFYGPTIGFGVDYKLNPSKKVYWTTALLVPLRSSEVQDYTDFHNLELIMLPISITFGCHIPIQ